MSENESLLKGISIRIGNDMYILPIASVKQSFKAKKENTATDPSGNEMINTHDGVYCLIRANDFFNNKSKTDIEEGLVVVLENRGRRICLLVDELIGQMDINVLTLPEYFKEVSYLSGCALIDDSEIALVINVQDLFSNVDAGLWNSELSFDNEAAACNDSEELDLHNEDSTKDKYLSFIIDNGTYCIEVSTVNEIISQSNVRKVPNAPSYAEGIISLRGKIVPVISIRKLFFMDSPEDSISTCIVVVDYRESLIGIKVDKVGEVILIKENEKQSPPNASSKLSNQYIQGIGKIGNSFIQMLDLEKLLAMDIRI